MVCRVRRTRASRIPCGSYLPAYVEAKFQGEPGGVQQRSRRHGGGRTRRRGPRAPPACARVDRGTWSARPRQPAAWLRGQRDGPNGDWEGRGFSCPRAYRTPAVTSYSLAGRTPLHQEQTRRERIARAVEELGDLKAKLRNPRTRIRSPAEVDRRIEEIVCAAGVPEYVRVERTSEEDHTFRQKTPGRPGPDTDFRRKTRRRHDIIWHIDELAIAYDRKSDGMYPLLTNDRSLSPGQVLEAHKGQPKIEKRFEQTKTVHEIAPVFLKNEARVEALFFLYFLGLLVQALIERELRKAMVRKGIEEIPLYPEERVSRRPTTEQVFRLFSLAQRHVLSNGGEQVKVFYVQLTELQREVLSLLGVPERAYRPPL